MIRKMGKVKKGSCNEVFSVLYLSSCVKKEIEKNNAYLFRIGN